MKWIQPGFPFFGHHLICCERWCISVSSDPKKSVKFDKVPEMFENDRAWNLTGSDKSAFIPIESNSFGKWIAKDTSIISITKWTSDVGYFFIHRPVVNLVIPVGPSAFHGSIVVHITLKSWNFLSSSGFTKIHRVSCLDGRRCFHDPSFRRGYISYLF